MAFPADLLENCSHDELESLSEDYLSYLRCADPDNPEYLSPQIGREVPISLSTVGYVPLYGGDQTHKILALFAPEDSLTAVALYLGHQWWTIDDVVRTSNSSREGLQQARSLGERIVLYVLNRIIYRKKEMERNEVPFLCHNSSDYAKILWRKGEAIGFYSVKPSGSMCTAYLTQNYTLPVLDTMFVRKRYRGKDFALQMLEDFVDCFTEDSLGLRYPLSSLMYTACKQYLVKYPGDQELLWEVEGVGHWFQRTLISTIIKRESQRLLETEVVKDDAVPQSTEQESVQPPAESQIEDSHETNQKEDIQIVESKGADKQVEPDEEKTVTNADASTAEEHDVTPVSTRTRSSHLKRPKIGNKVVETVVEDTASSDLAFNKLESKEQIVENFKELIQQLAEEKDEIDMSKLQEEISAKPVKQMLSESQDSEKEENSEDKQVLSPDELEAASDENMITGLEETVIQNEEFKERMVTKSAEDHTDNGLTGYTEGSTAEECPTSDETSTLDTGSIEETVHVTAETLPFLRQGPLLVVELQDVAFQHQSDGQRSISGEQSEGSVETDQSAHKSRERGAESSSEEVETEIPIVGRRGGLRRKGRGYKGPPKRRAKLSA
ncbi:soluble lamin-associated protein of 75 kDa isoform X2 [Bufo gargarizans]|uniref:soluble lamin-associated protein of 75 kDa isoform X2 n=1 Tax=Bufo gargarizans TaxID=30331 RepID=UPI001CF45C17|nr:soluble lamin-associated protein of 75 kDa isoform X2 [Bufo gargarizans]